MYQERRNNSRQLTYCQEAIQTIDISEENIGQHRYFRAFLIRRHSLPGCLRISNANIIPGHGRISVNHFSTVLMSRREGKFSRYARDREVFPPRQEEKYFILLSISSWFAYILHK